MAYRRTERVLQHLAARHDAIVAAARAIAAEQGLGAVQIAPVAARIRAQFRRSRTPHRAHTQRGQYA